MSSTRFDLTGKVALVTGGNGGIGLGMAEALAEAGAAVCIWGRNEEKNGAALQKLAAYGGRTMALPCDVSDEAQVEEALARTVGELGGVDACFANAGIGSRGTRFHEMTLEEWRMVVGTNLEGVFFTFRAAVRHMLKSGRGGSLVATSSLSARAGLARGQHYASAKAGLLAMVRGLAVEYARNGIRANAILPGWIETEMTEPIFTWDKFRDSVMPRIPQRRWGMPADFGAIAVYLASDASSYHTGDAMVIDGGYSCF